MCLNFYLFERSFTCKVIRMFNVVRCIVWDIVCTDYKKLRSIFVRNVGFCSVCQRTKTNCLQVMINAPFWNYANYHSILSNRSYKCCTLIGMNSFRNKSLTLRIKSHFTLQSQIIYIRRKMLQKCLLTKLHIPHMLPHITFLICNTRY